MKTFDQVIDEIITFGIDTCFSNITLNDDWFDFVINRTDDEEKFKEDIHNVVEKIRNYMES